MFNNHLPPPAFVPKSAERNDRDHLMHPPRHCYIVTDSLCQIQIMFQSENIQPYVAGPHHAAIAGYLPTNCAVVQSRYQQPFGRNPNIGVYHSMAHLPQQNVADTLSSHCRSGGGFNQKSISQLNLCTLKYEDEVLNQKEGAGKSHCEKFNALNHPLMAIDCRGGNKSDASSSRSLSPSSKSGGDSGPSSLSSTPGGYSRASSKSPRGSCNGNNNEPRGTKRHYQNNNSRTSRSPSPMMSCSSTTSSSSSNSSKTAGGVEVSSAAASQPKRRYQKESCGEGGLAPIVASACLGNIQLRSHRPENLLNGSQWDKLSHAIWCNYTNHEQTQETLRRKLRLREMVHNYIRSYYLNQCGLYIVGSSVSGFGGESSDMDLCLVISGHEVDQRFHALEYLYRVQKALKQCRFLTKLDVIRAKVPILRFFDSITNLEVDLNFNNIVGIRNTHLLKTYAQLDWRVRPLVLAVKLWARQHDINDAKSMTLSSYSLTLMVIHYLQCGVHLPVLPCLQKVRAERFWPEGDIRRLQGFSEDELKPLRSNNHLTLGQLFAGFLEYFAHQFNYCANAISIRLGCTIPVDQCRSYLSPKNDPHHWNYISIEEPFDRTNTARSVYDPITFQKIVEVFRQSAAKISQTKDLASVMT